MNHSDHTQMIDNRVPHKQKLNFVEARKQYTLRPIVRLQHLPTCRSLNYN